MALSLRRANAVKDALVREGVPAQAITRRRPRRAGPAGADRRRRARAAEPPRRDRHPVSETANPPLAERPGKSRPFPFAPSAKRTGTVAPCPITTLTTSSCCSAAAAATPMPPRPPRAARPTPSPTPGACRAPGSKANTPTSRPTPRACCWRAAISSIDLVEEADARRRRGSRAAARCSIANAGHLAPETIARIEAWLARRRPPPDRHRQDQPAAAPARAAVLRARAGAGLYRLALARRLAVRRRRLGARSTSAATRAIRRTASCRPPGSRVLADLVELSGDLSDATTATVARAGAGHRAHRPDRLRRQPGVRADRRHAAGPSQRRGGAPLGQRHALGRHAAVLPAPPDARGRPRRRCGRPGCARSAPTTACCRSATTSTACATTPSSTTRSRT